MFGYIYKITNTVTNAIYIGKTIYNIEHRYKAHMRDTHNQQLQESIDKYGVDNHKVEEIAKILLSSKDAERLLLDIEKFYIQESSDNKLLMNIQSNHKKLLEERNPKQYAFQLGLLKLKKSKARRKGSQKETLKRTLKKDMIARIKAGNTNLILEYGKTFYSNTKTILQKDKEGNIIQKWNNLMLITKVIGIDSSAIHNCLNKKRLTAGNFIWEYESDI